MPVTKLPKTLEHEPLMDALFEVRMEASQALADILPGILFHKLSPAPSLTRLPAAEIPRPMRESDPALLYVPTQRLDWGKYVIAVGDRCVSISCKLPYPKWPSFKAKILEAITLISEIGIAGKVERFSVKYVNLIEAPTIEDQIAKIDFELRIGVLEIDNERIELKVHHVEESFVHILTIVTGARAKVADEPEKFGVVVDIDSICDTPSIPFDKFAVDLEPKLETLRQSNKMRFFGCLKQTTVDDMRPVYE